MTKVHHQIDSIAGSAIALLAVTCVFSTAVFGEPNQQEKNKMPEQQRGNILPNLQPLVTWHKGENYVFGGCMRFLMERAKPGEPILADFDFFGGIGGDTAVQAYGRGFDRAFNCHDLPLSSFWDGADFCKHVFGEIGYDHTYVTHGQINANKAAHVEAVMAHIDKGMPVLQRWVPDAPNKGSCYTLLVGYEENGRTLLYLDGDSPQPEKYATDGNIAWDWIFIGDKKRGVDKKELHMNSLKRTLALLTAPDQYGASYGAKAFRDWADDIENGRFADGGEYTSYVCVLATNGRAFKTIMEQMPELAFVREAHAQIWKGQALWRDLEKMGGGFDVSREAMQDAEKRRQIAGKIREFAVLTDEVARILKENL